MASEFKSGDHVKCVDARRPLYHASLIGNYWPLAEGGEYVVERVVLAHGFTALEPGTAVRVCLCLVGIHGVKGGHPVHGGGFDARRFRHVRTTDISALRAHLQTIAARKPAKV